MPDLTPEERQLIYQEEKARMEARGGISRPKRRKLILVIAISAVGLIFVGTMLAKIFARSPFWDKVYSILYMPAVVAPAPSRAVIYDAEGIGYVNFTYINETGGSEQTFSNLPWKKAFTARSGQAVYVSGQNDNDAYLTLRLYVDGTMVQTAKAFGKYNVASVGGKLP